MRSCELNTNDIDVSLQSGQRSRKSFGACNTCTHVSHQQISILTLNFNTSFVGNLTNVATLEYFTLTLFFFVFEEHCFSCLAWVHRTLHVVGSC